MTLEFIFEIVLIVLIVYAFVLCAIALKGFIKEGFLRPRSFKFALPFGLLFVAYLLHSLVLHRIGPSDWAQIFLVLGLVLVTGFYALVAFRQADASVKMADGMARPVIDFKRDTAKIDINRQTLEVNAALTKDVSHGLSCILCNVGVGSAIDVRSFIQHPERGRLPFAFGTIESRGKTERWILSISHESNRIALVAYYEDIYGRTLKSSREVSIDKENHDWKLGRLKVVPVQEEGAQQ